MVCYTSLRSAASALTPHADGAHEAVAAAPCRFGWFVWQRGREEDTHEPVHSERSVTVAHGAFDPVERLRHGIQLRTPAIQLDCVHVILKAVRFNNSVAVCCEHFLSHRSFQRLYHCIWLQVHDHAGRLARYQMHTWIFRNEIEGVERD